MYAVMIARSIVLFLVWVSAALSYAFLVLGFIKLCLGSVLAGSSYAPWSPDWLSYALFGIHVGWAILGRSLGRVASDSGCWRLSAVDALLWLLLLVLLLVLLLMSTAGC